eukprot:1935701-Prymnesium_polylepis.1
MSQTHAWQWAPCACREQCARVRGVGCVLVHRRTGSVLVQVHVYTAFARACAVRRGALRELARRVRVERLEDASDVRVRQHLCRDLELVSQDRRELLVVDEPGGVGIGAPEELLPLPLLGVPRLDDGLHQLPHGPHLLRVCATPVVCAVGGAATLLPVGLRQRRAGRDALRGRAVLRNELDIALHERVDALIRCGHRRKSCWHAREGGCFCQTHPDVKRGGCETGIVWPMAGDVARGGVGSLRAPC